MRSKLGGPENPYESFVSFFSLIATLPIFPIQFPFTKASFYLGVPQVPPPIFPQDQKIYSPQPKIKCKFLRLKLKVYVPTSIIEELNNINVEWWWQLLMTITILNANQELRLVIWIFSILGANVEEEYEKKQIGKVVTVGVCVCIYIQFELPKPMDQAQPEFQLG